MTKKTAGIAEELLNAHVAFLAEELSGPGLQALVEEEIDEALVNLRKLRVSDITTRSAVKSTLHALILQPAWQDPLRDLAESLVQALHGDAVHSRTAVADLVDDERFQTLLELSVDMAPLRERVVREIISSPLYAAFAADLLYAGIKGYLLENVVARRIPGAQSMMKLGRAVLSKATPDLEATIEEGLKKYIIDAVQASTEGSIRFLLGDQAIRLFRRSANEVWQRARDTDLGQMRDAVTPEEVQTLAHTGYQLGATLRHSRWLRTLGDTAIDTFFELYESRPVAELLDQLGIHRDALVEETMRHAPKLMATLKKKKMLEPLLRRRLRGFYRSGAVERVLETAGEA
jgi:hypothetical protein